jgi:hypothetical protein
MAKHLGNEDRQTIDLLLDGAARSQTGGISLQGVTSNDRISAAQRLLSLIDAMPSAEPPADLVERTLRLIDRSSPRREHVTLSTPTFAPNSQSHA